MPGKESASTWKNQACRHQISFVEAERVKLIYCASKNMIANLLTKGLPIKQLENWEELANALTVIEKEYWRYTISARNNTVTIKLCNLLGLRFCKSRELLLCVKHALILTI